MDVRLFQAFSKKLAEHVPVPDPVTVKGALRPVLVHLLALYHLYYFAHWTSRGRSFYSDHELFSRVYSVVQKEFDNVAERLMGHVGDEAINGVFPAASAKSTGWLNSTGDQVVGTAVKAETDLQAVLHRAYITLDQQNALTLGIDDLLMQISSTHEGHLYLLRQRMAGAKE